MEIHNELGFGFLEKIIVELKSVEKFHNSRVAQTLNYLKATGLKVGYLINFGKQKLE